MTVMLMAAAASVARKRVNRRHDCPDTARPAHQCLSSLASPRVIWSFRYLIIHQWSASLSRCILLSSSCCPWWWPTVFTLLVVDVVTGAATDSSGCRQSTCQWYI